VISILLVLASLMGAGGVGLAAAAAHAAPASGLEAAAYLMLFHAVAVLGVASLSGQKLLLQPLGLIAMASFVAGGVLFAGDISMRAFAGHRLFPMAAPTGGMLLILGWLVVAGATVAAVGRAR
jgi:uncharacterized membrane protein YgdD (TMEM256/DUF423 family)